MFLKINNMQRGVSLVEFIIALAIGGLLIAAVSLFFGRGISINRTQFQQVLITEDARTQLNRMTDQLRNARDVSTGEWLVEADDYSVTFYSNVDENTDYEQVRYFVEGTNLRRGVTPEEGEETVRTVARSIRNISSSRPVFTYYDAEGNTIASSLATSSNVFRIVVTLLVDTNPDRPPTAAEVVTAIIPRQKLSVAGGGTSEVDTSNWYVTLDYPSTPASGTGGSSSGSDKVEVTVTNPDTATSTTSVVPIAQVNDGRLATYLGGYYTNINYQPSTIGTDGPGWYAWIGPIEVGQSGNQTYEVTDKMTATTLCTGAELSTLIDTCADRTVSQGSFSKTYQPILTYGIGANRYYVRSITFTYTGT